MWQSLLSSPDAALIARHPETTFIGAHVGGYPENLEWVTFFLRHADRILFGTDLGPDPEMSRIYYRFLETRDEYFNPAPGDVPRQGRWHIYGLGLPEEVLEKVYLRNATRLLNLDPDV